MSSFQKVKSYLQYDRVSHPDIIQLSSAPAPSLLFSFLYSLESLARPLAETEIEASLRLLRMSQTMTSALFCLTWRGSAVCDDAVQMTSHSLTLCWSFHSLSMTVETFSIDSSDLPLMTVVSSQMIYQQKMIQYHIFCFLVGGKWWGQFSCEDGRKVKVS